MLFSVEQAFVGREEIRAPLKTPAWEASHNWTHTRNTEKTESYSLLHGRAEILNFSLWLNEKKNIDVFYSGKKIVSHFNSIILENAKTT